MYILSYRFQSRFELQSYSAGPFIIHNSKERNFVELSASDTMPLLKVELPDYVDVKRRSVLEKYMTSLWNSSIAYQEEPKIAVNVSQLGDLLEIYKQGHDGIISIIGEGGVPDVIRGADRKEMIELVRRGKNVPDGSDQLLVYDLDGTMLRKYKLNRRVNGFDIDTVNQVLVMVNSNTEAPMYTFPLPEEGLDRFLSFSDRLKTHIKYGSFVFRTVYRLRSYLRWNTVSRTKPARAKGAPTKAGYWYPNPHPAAIRRNRLPMAFPRLNATCTLRRRAFRRLWSSGSTEFAAGSIRRTVLR